MYEQFFGLAENPFSLTPDPRFIFASRSHDEALAHLKYWVEHREGFAMITGEVGTGKTTALFSLIEGMDRHYEIAFLTNSTLNAVELLEEICRKFRIEIEKDSTKPALLARLETHLMRLGEMGHGAVLIIDEAQNFEHSLLEEVRLLSNVTRPGGSQLLQIALVGQPELERKLSSPELRQLKQRIGVHYRIDPLSEDETGRYVHHRVSVAGGYPRVLFPPQTILLLYQKTHGLPREINQVASQALLHAYVEESTSVRPDHIQSAVNEMGFKSVLDRGVTLTVTAPSRAPAPGPEFMEGPSSLEAPSASPTVGVAGSGSAARERSPRRLESAPSHPAPRPMEPAPRAPVRIRAEQPNDAAMEERRSFGALPPIRTATTGMLEIRNPMVRRLVFTGAAVVILAIAAMLIFGPPKPKQDDLKDIESETTIPTVPRSNSSISATAVPREPEFNPGGSPSTGAAKPPTATMTGTGTATPTPVSVQPAVKPAAPPPAVRDSIEHKTSLSATPATSTRAAVMKAYHLQVASLRDSVTAESMGRRLARLMGASYVVDRTTGADLPWYAVYLGPYATRADADTARGTLAGLDHAGEGAIIRPPNP